jgi:hypothetical protein
LESGQTALAGEVDEGSSGGGNLQTVNAAASRGILHPARPENGLLRTGFPGGFVLSPGCALSILIVAIVISIEGSIP